LHSIYPVYGENYDDIVGVVNLKIFCSFWNEDFNLSYNDWSSFMMEQTAYVALENFKNREYIMLL
jgi:putative hemolysin